MDWARLLDLREQKQQRVAQDVAAARAVLAPLQQEEARCTAVVEREVQARTAHAEGLRHAAAGGLSVAALRGAGDWNGACDQRIAQALQALGRAHAACAAQQRRVDAELQRLARARAAVERARRQHERSRAEALRAHERRQEQAIEETSLQVWSAAHGA